MDILIKGMEMPSEGRIINLTICSDGSVINNLPDAGGKMSSYRSERVKAVALPSHGDLIDRDKASTQIIAEICQFCASAENGNCYGCLVQKCLEAIGRVPTIVEASE